MIEINDDNITEIFPPIKREAMTKQDFINHAHDACSGLTKGGDAQKTIGDVNSDERGSGARFNNGKPDYSLIPMFTLADEARVWEYGKNKYAAWNWAKGQNWSIPYACALRHLAAWQAGEVNDPESGLPHIAHAMCNLRMIALFSKTYPEGDDRAVSWLLEALHD